MKKGKREERKPIRQYCVADGTRANGGRQIWILILAVNYLLFGQVQGPQLPHLQFWKWGPPHLSHQSYCRGQVI